MASKSIKSILRNAYLTLYVVRTHGRYFEATLRIETLPEQPGESRDVYLTISAQAHDMRVPDPLGSRADSGQWKRSEGARRHSDLYLRDVSPFYAVHADCRVDMTGFGDARYSPDRALAVKKAITAAIEEKNLRYVYPDCELSLTLAALEALGCRIDWNKWLFEGQERGVWLRARGESQAPQESVQ